MKSIKTMAKNTITSCIVGTAITAYPEALKDMVLHPMSPVTAGDSLAHRIGDLGLFTGFTAFAVGTMSAMLLGFTTAAIFQRHRVPVTLNQTVLHYALKGAIVGGTIGLAITPSTFSSLTNQQILIDALHNPISVGVALGLTLISNIYSLKKINPMTYIEKLNPASQVINQINEEEETRREAKNDASKEVKRMIKRAKIASSNKF